jgi:hypothetical protein
VTWNAARSAGVTRVESLDVRAVGRESVGSLGGGRFRVPLVPHGRREVVVRLRSRQPGVEPRAHDDGAGAEVREDVGNGPLGGVRRRDDLVIAERLDDAAQVRRG